MTDLTFDRSYVYATSDEVRLPVRLRPLLRPAFVIEVVLDTGATISLFDIALCSRLGIQVVENGAPRTVRLADDSQVEAFLHEVQVDLLGKTLRAPVLFCPSFPRGVDSLLGIRGVLDQVDIAILHGERRLYIR